MLEHYGLEKGKAYAASSLIKKLTKDPTEIEKEAYRLKRLLHPQ